MMVALHVLRTELLQLVRDKRALFSAVVLPAILYPIFFWGSGKLETVGRETMAARDVVVRMDLDEVAPDLQDALMVELREAGPTSLQLVDADEFMVAVAAAGEDPPTKELRDAARTLLASDQPGALEVVPKDEAPQEKPAAADAEAADLLILATALGDAVSYTHLTLPTIYSV